MSVTDYTAKIKSICDSLGSINVKSICDSLRLTKKRWCKYAWAASRNDSTR